MTRPRPTDHDLVDPVQGPPRAASQRAVALADEGFCFNGATEPTQRAERAASYARARNVPEIFLPSELKNLIGGRAPTAQAPDPRPDARVAAVTLAVPVAAIFTPESLARVRIPVGLVTASADQGARQTMRPATARTTSSSHGQIGRACLPLDRTGASGSRGDSTG